MENCVISAWTESFKCGRTCIRARLCRAAVGVCCCCSPTYCLGCFTCTNMTCFGRRLLQLTSAGHESMAQKDWKCHCLGWWAQSSCLRPQLFEQELQIPLLMLTEHFRKAEPVAGHAILVLCLTRRILRGQWA